MEQAQKNSWTVGALGLSDIEFNVLKSVASLTSSRKEDSYVAYAAGNIPSDCNILILNADNPESMVQWSVLAVRPNPPLLVNYSSVQPADSDQHYLLRPFGPAKLLVLLDRIARQLRESAQVWGKPAPSHAAQTVTTTGDALRALVVDDSPTVSRQLELELRNFNIKAEIADTGEYALELLSGQKFDIIFLDVILPGTDGYQICKQIRKNPRTRHTPVVMLTSKSSPFDRVRGSLAGCSAYLTKPVDYNMFRETVEKYVCDMAPLLQLNHEQSNHPVKKQA
jgi:two-component system cell cycle response regulator